MSGSPEADMEEGQGVHVTSSSLVDAPVDDGKTGDSLVADTSKCVAGSLSDDGVWLSDWDEEADEAFCLDREGKKRREEFYNAGYRDGLTAGKNDAAQDGFNQGFKDSVMVGYKWGIIRGVTSALAHLPNELKLKLVETEDKRNEFLNLYEAVDSIGTEDALKLFYDGVQRGASMERKKTVMSPDSSISHTCGSNYSDLEQYFDKLDLLLKETPVVDVQLELNGIK